MANQHVIKQQASHIVNIKNAENNSYCWKATYIVKKMPRASHVVSIRPRMEKSHLKRHKLFFCRALSGLVRPKQDSLTELYVKRRVRGVSIAIFPFLGGFKTIDMANNYGVATICRLLKMIGLFCRISSLV